MTSRTSLTFIRYFSLLSALLWGCAAAIINVVPSLPDTGVTRSYSFNITRSFIAPDGVNKSALVVNGAFPGPLLEANWGDIFEITVTNLISGPAEGTSLHWHGLLQNGTPYSDGVSGIHQCPIAPGKSFTYRFRADSYGTSWWHAHYSAQYVDGLMGPMIIHGPEHVDYDIDLGPVILSDNYHNDYHTYVEMANGIPFQVPYSDNNLINGKMFYNCSLVINGQKCISNSPVTKFNFDTGKVHLLRLINAGGEGLQHFGIDGHNLTVIANDFTPIQPYETEFITLGVGQRTDVLVAGTGKPSESYWMRSNISTVCSPANQPYALAAIYYPDADLNKEPVSFSSIKPYTETCGNVGNPFLMSSGPRRADLDPPSTPSTVQDLDFTLGSNSSGNTLWFVNGVSFRANYDQPPLLLAKVGNTSYPYDPQWNVYNFGSNSSVRLVLRNMAPLVHPIHLHGHNFWILAEGVGSWNGSVNNSNPQRRDTQLLPPGNPTNPSYLVIEYVANNPGVWPLHCHIAWHVSTGLFISTLEQPEAILDIRFPSSVGQTCRDWAAFSNHTVVDQIDSGL